MVKSRESSPVRPKTPKIMKIKDSLKTPLKMDHIPENKVEMIHALISEPANNQALLKSVLYIAIFAVMIVCVILFSIGNKDSQNRVADTIGSTVLPYYIYNPWFVLVFLIVSMAAFAYIIHHIPHISFAFTGIIALFLLSWVMIFVKLYFSVAVYSAALQIWSFILLFTSALIALYVVQNAHKMIKSLLALAPTVIFAGFMIYTGGKLNVKEI